MLHAIVNQYWGSEELNKQLTKTYVICPNIDLCKNTDCLHSKPHEPIGHKPGKADTCINACICPMVGTIVKCKEWEEI